MKKLFIITFFICSSIAHAQVWQVMHTSENAFSYERDGQKVAYLRDGTAVAVGGWHVIANYIQETNNEVYFSSDKGVTWERQPDAPWPASHDFIFESSVTGDTLVKYGIDGANREEGVKPRIDIFTKSSGWQLLYEWDADSVNNGLVLTGCRHRNYYYMLSYKGQLHRFTLEHPQPELVATLDDSVAVQSGFMISLPNGRLIYGGGRGSNGYTGNVYYSDDDGFTWALLTHNDIFKTYWCTARVLKTGVIYWKGRNDITNQRGVYVIPIENLAKGVDVDDWTLLKYTPEPRHAQGFCTVLDENGDVQDEAIGVCGNLWNDSWLFKRMDYDQVQDVILEDNCSFKVPDVTSNFNEGAVILQSPQAGTLIQSSQGKTHEITITAAQTDGSSKNYSVLLCAKDIIKPDFTVPPDSIVYIGQNCTVLIPDLTTSLTGQDNCGVVTFRQNPKGGTLLSSTSGEKYPLALIAYDGNGNSSEKIITLTAKDTIKPVINCPTNIEIVLSKGANSVDTTLTAPVVTDNCSVDFIKATRSDGKPMNAPYLPGVTTIMWEATDLAGNTSNCVQKISVQDKEPPTITNDENLKFCHQASDFIFNIPPIKVSDNCAVGSITYSVSGSTTRNGIGQDASGVFNEGTSIISWTATDTSGNLTTSSMSVDIATPLKLSIPDVFSPNLGSIANTYYLDYNPTPLELEAHVSGGIAPYSVQWSNSASDSSLIIIPTEGGKYVYQAIVTDSIGCKAAESKEISAIYIRCGARMENLTLCVPKGDNYITMCVSEDAAKRMLESGAYLGLCNEISIPEVQHHPELYGIDTTNAIFLNVFPNPSNSYFTLIIRNDGTAKTNDLKVFNSLGELIETKRDLPSGLPYQFGSAYPSGTYFLEVTHKTYKSHLIIVKTH